MPKTYRTSLIALILTFWATTSFAQEAAQLSILRSDAPLAEKAAACRQLARIGTKEAVPVLASLLNDEKLSHMARTALEPIPDPAVDEALRDALGKLSGRLRVGVISSLGVRRDAKAVEPLSKLLADPDPDTAAAAARALGSIGTVDAAEMLQAAMANAASLSDSQKRRLHIEFVAEGLLRAAEALSASGKKDEAQAIYDRLRSLENAPAQVRTAAWRGSIVVRGDAGAALLIEALRSTDKAIAAAGMRAATELAGGTITDALAAELAQAPAGRRGLLIEVLAQRGDPRVLPAVLKAAQSDDAQLRLIALRALKRVGDASCVPALLDAAAKGDKAVAQAAVEAIAALQGESVDQQIAARLAEAKGSSRATLLEIAGRRRIAAAAPSFWTAVDDPDAAVRLAALTGLGAVIDTRDLPKLIARLSKAKDEQEATALDKALRDVCLRAADRESAAKEIAAAVPTVPAPLKAKLLETLNQLGGNNALAAVAAAARSNDSELRDAAYRTLGQWKSIDAAPVLLELHRDATDDRLKVRAIRAYIRIARQFDMPAERRAEMCRKAMELAQRDEDKRLVLEVLLRYPTDEMRSIAVEAAKVPALKDEASLILMALAQSKNVNRAELGKALAQAGHQQVKLEIVKATYGAGEKTKDVTEALRHHAKNYRIIFLPGSSYNEAFGGDPAPGTAKQLRIHYRIDGKEGEVLLNENSPVVLPMVK